MKRIKITAICISLLTTLSTVGCVCTPGYYSGMPRTSYGHGNVVFDNSCNSCDPCSPEIECSVVEFDCNPCAPRPKIVNCRTSLANISNGTLLVGRGMLDIAAAPFVVIGNVLSSGCQYEVIAHCPDVRYGGPVCQPLKPCSSVSTSGCDSCDNGYSEGIQFDVSSNGRTMLSQPMQYGNNSIIQASHREPTASGVRFVQPR